MIGPTAERHPDGPESNDASVFLRALGIDNPGSIDVGPSWAQRRSCADREWAQIPVGVKPGGQPQHITFRAKDLGGCGFHSVVIGTAGSGKSTFLLSMVYSIAMTHSPDAFTVVVADPHQESIADQIRGLPHVVAAAAGLCGRDHQRAELLRNAIDAELARRYWLFASVGACDAVEYEAIRLAGRDVEPVPILLVVVEDYPQMFDQHPLWIDLITEIGQMGRSANVFFMLCGQQWDESSLSKMVSNIGFRVALRAQTHADSRQVIGCDAAYSLPPDTSGLALLHTGDGQLEPFRCLDVSVPVVAPPIMSAGGARGQAVVPHAGCSQRPFSDLLRESIKAAGYSEPAGFMAPINC